MKPYISRIADKLLKEALKSSGAVLIEGPKWCGKTRTGLEFARSSLFMQDPDTRESNIQAAHIKPSLLLQGETPRLIDEWQVTPILWDAVRHEVDLRGEDGQFILTGSAVPIMDHLVSHTGTGRISRIKMRTMSLFESGESSGDVSLLQLFMNQLEIHCAASLTIEKIAKVIVRGGWPTSVTADQEHSEKRVQNYVDAIVQSDVSLVDGVDKNPNKVMALLKSYARNISSEASYETLKKDVEGGEGETLTTPTISSYLNALQRIFVIEDLPAWSPSIRSKTPLRLNPKRHFIDPSIATASLDLNHEQLLTDFKTFGLLFESLCIKDLRIYGDSLGGKVYHYRDKTGLECDAVIVLRNGDWGAIEIKLGAHEFDKAAENLLKLRDRINTDKMKNPSFLMILTGTNFGYKRDDGILVVPIGCLKD